MPVADDPGLQWVEFTDFSPGIFSNNLLSGGVQVTAQNPAMAQDTLTFRCIALPSGGLGPLPRLQASYGLDDPPGTGVFNDHYNVAGFSSWGRILAAPTEDTTTLQTEIHVVLHYETDDGDVGHLAWIRERLFDSDGGTEVLFTDSDPTGGNSPRYAYLMKTRMNPTDPGDPGIPVMACVANVVNDVSVPIMQAWPDPDDPDSNDTIEICDGVPGVIAAAHQGRIVIGKWAPYNHGVDANLITNENVMWTNVNSNELESAVPAVFVPELDSTISDLCPMSANALLVIKMYGGAYVLQGSLGDVTVIQLPNLPCPDGSDFVRGVNTSSGYIYSAGPAGMYQWNGGDSAELISGQLDGNFAVGSNFINGANGQCDRWMDRVLVPQNWIWDANMKSWWRIEDPEVVNIRFWTTTSRSSYAFGAETTFDDENPEFFHRFQYTDLARSYQWTGQPLWLTRDRYFEARSGLIALQGHGEVTINLIDHSGEIIDQNIIPVDSDVIRNTRFPIAFDGEYLIVQIISEGEAEEGDDAPYDAPLVHRLFIGYHAAQHLPVTYQMPTINRTSAEYEPEDNPLYSIPVQQGSVENIVVQMTPAGHAVVGWVDAVANEYRSAIIPDFNDVFEDDVVPPGDVRTAWSSGTRALHTGVLWVWDGTLRLFVSHSLDANGLIEMYVADDVENPVTWTFVSTIQNHTAPGFPGVRSVRQAGTPTITGDGEVWCLPMHSWLTFAAAVLEDGIGVFSTNDQGATWATEISLRRGALASGTAGPQSTAISNNPDTGILVFGFFIGPTNQWRVGSSPAGGETWNAGIDVATPGISPQFFIDDTNVLYAAVLGGGALNLYIVDNEQDFSTWTDLGMSGIVTDAISEQEGIQTNPIWSAPGVYYGVVYSAKDRVAFNGACENLHPDPLFIPWKNSLSNLEIETDEEGVDRLSDASVAIVKSQEFDNLKTIERWARQFMVLTQSDQSCLLFIPFKDYLDPMISSFQMFSAVADHAFDNFKTIERWGYRILAGECGCLCDGSANPADKCIMDIPYKDRLRTLVDVAPTAASLEQVASQSFDAYKTIERWANRYASGECGCSR